MMQPLVRALENMQDLMIICGCGTLHCDAVGYTGEPSDNMTLLYSAHCDAMGRRTMG